MSGSAQYINPVTAARGSRAVRFNITCGLSRDFLCLMYFQVPRDFKLYCLLNELSGFLRIVCLSLCSVTTMGPWRNVYGKRNTNCFMTKPVYSFIIVLILGILVIHTIIPRTIWF